MGKEKIHELRWGVSKYYSGAGADKHKRLVKRKARCTCGYATHSTKKMNVHLRKYFLKKK